ncbi:hypothetical protein NA57DRAFT_51579 [Rhizodiscina lignyota]|uniref:GDP/GTP exchange factor Sec2 N-terminal domain-containing protein n=1 Tax=Rhizodiscina lignyota TaxID=1504668 RepID=A0A9P4ISW2_9PEZI|nr:hypothetical protein NA57DRAFT_51579 [Rhizodiscina lignyota]
MSTVTTAYARPVEVSSGSPPPLSSACSNCGAPYSLAPERLPKDAQRRIAELEAQVKILTDKATAAVDKLADYEDELRRLKSKQSARGSINNLVTSSDTNLLGSVGQDADGAQEPSRPPTQSRFSSLLGSRKASPANGNSSSRPTSVREVELQEALQRELEARQQAETKVTQMSGELEELSAQLFQQANEMVATERKARAKLEERVEVLEKRDGDKRKRLERLESAVKRIERVNGLLKG